MAHSFYLSNLEPHPTFSVSLHLFPLHKFLPNFSSTQAAQILWKTSHNHVPYEISNIAASRIRDS